MTGQHVPSAPCPTCNPYVSFGGRHQSVDLRVGRPAAGEQLSHNPFDPATTVTGLGQALVRGSLGLRRALAAAEGDQVADVAENPFDSISC